MKHKGTVPLETERLILRRLVSGDADAVFRNWASNPQVSKYARQQPHNSIEETKEYCDGIISSYSDETHYFWVIVPKDLNEPIGRVNITQQNEVIEMVHVSFMIGERWWNNGYMSEALAEILRFFFKTVGVNRIEGRNDPQNPSSSKVMTKCGFQYEGILRQGGRNSFGLVDCEQYAILAEDYFETSKNERDTQRP